MKASSLYSFIINISNIFDTVWNVNLTFAAKWFCLGMLNSSFISCVEIVLEASSTIMLLGY